MEFKILLSFTHSFYKPNLVKIRSLVPEEAKNVQKFTYEERRTTTEKKIEKVTWVNQLIFQTVVLHWLISQYCVMKKHAHCEHSTKNPYIHQFEQTMVEDVWFCRIKMFIIQKLIKVRLGYEIFSGFIKKTIFIEHIQLCEFEFSKFGQYMYVILIVIYTSVYVYIRLC